MADSTRPRKRRRIPEGKKKLLVDEKVEVRSLEDGFLGSWHPGTIIACATGARQVRYDHILTDQGIEYLAEYVEVCSHVDGGDAVQGSTSNFRGRIRPFPPVSVFERRLQYGLCVDAYHNEAWWEGVVFDPEDNSLERKIFFPDLGDEMIVKAEDVRVTLDWNEVTEEWTPRGKWLLLEIIQEYEQEMFIPVSARQIWYDVRNDQKYGQVAEWTSPDKSMWQKLIEETLFVYTRLFLDSYFRPFDCLQDAILQKGDDPTPPPGLMTIGPFSSHRVDDHCLALSLKAHSSCSMPRRGRKSNKTKSWQPVGPDMVPGAECSPRSVSAYLASDKPGPELTTELRKHLLYLGFTIHYRLDGHMQRFLYASPRGKVYYSLRHICRDRELLGLEDTSPASEHNSESSVHPNFVKVDAEYCPEAVIEYLGCEGKTAKQRLGILQERARKHLSAMGWSFWFCMKAGRYEWRYTSPQKKTYYSLRTACKGFVAGGINANGLPISWSEDVPRAEDTLPLQHVAPKEPLDSKVLMKSTIQLKENFLKRRSLLSKSPPGLGKPRKRLDIDSPRRVLRSTKRARQVVSSNSLHRNPRTILSWLIDNNVLLPREKVYYRRQKDHRPLAEGRITRDGIKCNCCQKVFSISKFEVHAGSNRHRPSANIYVEDGRSLVECQMQMLRGSHKSTSRGSPVQESKKQHKKSYNDNICSVCHYGGKLILCDQCPSSFHASCLNLQDIPEGDWFCPSCRCGICFKSQLDGENTRIVFCNQCERQYHVGCLGDRRAITSGFQPKERWFCSDSCEKIYFGLQKINGLPIPLGMDDLTWTLVKEIQSENDEMDDSNIEVVAENHSKLNVALEVLHECFEPMKEPRTNRDLVEDVIFSRGSELNRLNFRGFYTVLLERNEEVISVATLRVYGEKVAEIPLVGTRLQFRRLGMCRVLFNEIEKRLLELGVERLILPAAPSVLSTWINAFGFSKMTKAERYEFLAYNFLDFQGTVMCHKPLRKPSSCGPRKLRIILREPSKNGHRRSTGTEFDENSAFSEVMQEDKTERSESVDQGPLKVAEGNCNETTGGLLPMENGVNETANQDNKAEGSVEYVQDEKVDGLNCNELIKYYRRKKGSVNMRQALTAC